MVRSFVDLFFSLWVLINAAYSPFFQPTIQASHIHKASNPFKSGLYFFNLAGSSIFLASINTSCITIPEPPAHIVSHVLLLTWFVSALSLDVVRVRSHDMFF